LDEKHRQSDLPDILEDSIIFSGRILFRVMTISGSMEPLFPSLSSHLLSGKKVTLPDDCKGFVPLIAIAFPRGAQGMIDSWYEPFPGDYSNNQNARF